MGNDTGRGPLRGGCEGWVGLDWPQKERWEKPQPWVSANLDLPRVALVCRYAFPDTEPCRYLEIPRGVCLHWNALPRPSCLSRDWVSQITGSLGIAVSASRAPQPCPLGPPKPLWKGLSLLSCKIKWMHLWIRCFWALDQSLACRGSGPLSEWV